MIWTLIVLGVIVIGVVLIILYFKNILDEFWTYLSVPMIFIGGIVMIILLVNIGVDQGKGYNIEKAKQEKAELVYQLDEAKDRFDTTDIHKMQIYTDIKEWNNKVYKEKYGAADPWTSWFHSQKYANSLEYIELP